MMVFLLTFFGILLILLAVIASTALSRKPISGSCGGLSSLSEDGNAGCSICGSGGAKQLRSDSGC